MTIDEKLTEVYGAAGLERIKAEQKTKLLPQLQKKRAALEAKAVVLQREINDISRAEDEIEAGRITDYQIRKPKEKATE